MRIVVGRQYRNKKHGTLYRVLGYTTHSESLEVLVTYERVEPEERGEFPYSRPFNLFKEKFEQQ